MDCRIQRYRVALERKSSGDSVACIRATGTTTIYQEPCSITIEFAQFVSGTGSHKKFGPGHIVRVIVPEEDYERYLEFFDTRNPLTASWDTSPGSDELSWFELTG